MNTLPKLCRQLKRIPDKAAYDFRLHVTDPRDPRGRRWKFEQCMWALLLGFAAGTRNYREVESLTERFRGRSKRLVPRRLPDTTLRALVAEIDPREIADMATGQVKDLYRNSMLPTGQEFPFRVVAVDGKYQTLNRALHPESTPQRHAKGEGRTWKLGFTRAVLVSGPAKVCLKVARIPKGTNEMSSFPAFFEELNADFPSDSFFEVLTMDAGFASRKNMNMINERGRGFICALKDNQPELAREAERLFDLDEATQEAEWTSPWRREAGREVRVQIRRTRDVENWNGWSCVRQAWRVTKELKREGKTERVDRTFVTNLPEKRCTAQQAAAIVRAHWGIENGCHWTLDTQWAEDDSVISTANSSYEVLIYMRTLAYNLCQVLKNKTLGRVKVDRYDWNMFFFDVKMAMTMQTEDEIMDAKTGFG
jgi:predicted transposase YbfD/YdcC